MVTSTKENHIAYKGNLPTHSFNEFDLESMTNNSMKLVEVLEPFQKGSKPPCQRK
jgi:hypothetical protein